MGLKLVGGIFAQHSAGEAMKSLFPAGAVSVELADVVMGHASRLLVLIKELDETHAGDSTVVRSDELNAGVSLVSVCPVYPDMGAQGAG